MRRLLAAASMATTLSMALQGTACAAPPALRVTHQIAVPGAAAFDYLLVDAPSQRLYLSHGNQVEVLDTATEKWIGRVVDTPGVRGIAVATELGFGYATNGKADTVTVFDLASFAPLHTLAVGRKPDFILYDPRTQRVLVFNNLSQDMSVIDATRNEIVATVALQGEPESAALDDQGRVHLNLEDSNETVLIDPVQMRVLGRAPAHPCQRPVGLGIDAAGPRQAGRQLVASSCGNQWLIVSQAADGLRVGAVRIGAGAEGVAWLDGLAYSADGLDGTLSVVGPTVAGGWAALGTIVTAMGARRIAVDTATHRLYVPAAMLRRVDGSNRLQGIDGTLHLLVLERR